MQIGQVSPKVEVTGEAPVVQPAQEVALTDYETVCREKCCWRSAPNKLPPSVDA
jgi:hypothetical protein